MKISKEFGFEASHILLRHHGKCSRLHGHSWRIQVEVEGDVRKDSQFVLDYADLSKLVEPIVDRFDHQHLNFYIQYPSAENIALHIAHELRLPLSGMDRLIVRVSETAKTWAVWDSGRTADLRMLEDPSEGNQWRAPRQERVITDLGLAREKIQRLSKLASTSLDIYTQYMTEAASLQMYIDSLDFNPEIPGKEKESIH